MLNPKLIIAALIVFLVFCLIFVFGAVMVRADDIVIQMKNFSEGDLKVEGFELKGQTRISIYAIGGELKNADQMFAYGWIINSSDREPVWIMEEQETHRYEGSRYLRECEDEVTLPAGKYECYYYVGRPYSLEGMEIIIEDMGDAFKWLGDIIDTDEESKREYYSEDIKDLQIMIKAPDGTFTRFDPVLTRKKSAIVDFSQPGDDYFAKRGFTLKKELPLKIIAIGEYSSSDRVFVDHGWIIDADSLKKVWQMDKWNTSWAGGGRKNRSFVGEVTLPPGNYLAQYISDDSHSFERWNVQPPYDPMHYGMVIAPVKESDRQFISDFEISYAEPVVVALSRVGDDEFVSKGFTLKKAAAFHVVALGEFGYDDEFADYGWIEDIDSGEKIWEMTEENCTHAGGASKNRRFDGIVKLPAGNYMVYYSTDDSHAYNDWNASPPMEKELWGITLYGFGKNFDKNIVEYFDQIPSNSNVLVDLTGLGDDEKARREFELKSAAKVKVVALGEGKGGHMYDYGWIENAQTGETVWEMTYRMTRHAGGADKNRKVDTQIFLEAGRYEVYFVTDDSHSFPDFNASRPENPQRWGIMVLKD